MIRKSWNPENTTFKRTEVSWSFFRIDLDNFRSWKVGTNQVKETENTDRKEMIYGSWEWPKTQEEEGYEIRGWRPFLMWDKGTKICKDVDKFVGLRES